MGAGQSGQAGFPGQGPPGEQKKDQVHLRFVFISALCLRELLCDELGVQVMSCLPSCASRF